MVAITRASGCSRPAAASAPSPASAMRSGSGSLRRPIRVIEAPAIHASVIRGHHFAGTPPKIQLPRATRWLHPRGTSSRRRRRGDPELADQPEQIGALETERPRGVRSIALRLEKRGLDEPPLEVADRAVVADRA